LPAPQARELTEDEQKTLAGLKQKLWELNGALLTADGDAHRDIRFELRRTFCACQDLVSGPRPPSPMPKYRRLPGWLVSPAPIHREGALSGTPIKDKL
jgi:hypothetical protein